MDATRLRRFACAGVVASLPLVGIGLSAVSSADPGGPCPVGMNFNVNTNQCEVTPLIGPGPVGPGPVGPGPVGPGPVGPGPIGPGR